MGRSLALGLYLLLSRGGDVGATELPAPGEGTGPLVWIQTGPDTPLAGIAHLARQMARERTDLRFLVTFEDAPRTGVEFPPGTVTTKAPASSTLCS